MSIKNIKEKLHALRTVRIKAGVLKGTYSDGTSIAKVAMENEFGTSRIPARPFMRQTVQEKKNDWGDRMVGNMNAYLKGNASLDEALGNVGELMQSDLVGKVNSNMPPPNSPETIAQKKERGMTPRTLIDTGKMIKAISYEVQHESS